MSGNSFIPSLEDYKKSLGNASALPEVAPSGTGSGGGAARGQEKTSGLMPLSQYSMTVPQSSQQVALSPILSGKAASVSPFSRQSALSFAHPVDAAVIRALDNPAVNAVFNKVVQASIDASFGLSLATGIHISPGTYPEIYKVIVDCANKLDIPVPYVIVSDQVKGINAVTAGTDQFAFIAISSLLPVVMNPAELQFVIGHECGHLALGHVVYHTAINVMAAAGGLLPLVGNIVAKTIAYPLNAWSRRSEVSADRAGLICCGDVRVAQRALLKLTTGLLNTESVDIDAYVRDSEHILENSSIGKYAEFNQQHPIIPKRIKALDLFSRSDLYAQISGGRADAAGLVSDQELISQIEKVISVL